MKNNHERKKNPTEGITESKTLLKDGYGLILISTKAVIDKF
jgi:hypothetical protein